MKIMPGRAHEQADEVAQSTQEIRLQCEEAKAHLKQMVTDGERARQEARHMREQAREMKVWLDNLTDDSSSNEEAGGNPSPVPEV